MEDTEIDDKISYFYSFNSCTFLVDLMLSL